MGERRRHEQFRQHQRTRDRRAGKTVLRQGAARPDDRPVFESAVEDWDEHLAKLSDFWSSVMLTSGRYKGNPMAAHIKQPIEPDFFDRWLGLWRETANEVFAPEAAEQFKFKAERIAESLKLAMFYRPDAIRIAPRPPQ